MSTMTAKFQRKPDDGHDHHWPELVIDDSDLEGVTVQGLHILAPCEWCGMTALDGLERVVDEAEDAQTREMEARKALAGLVLVDDRPLFHWSPTRHRKQIIRHGLRPGRKPTTSSVDPDDVLNAGWRSPCVCFADTPSWAWALSGGMGWTPDGEWDLWQTSTSDLTDPIVMPDQPGEGQRPSGIYEVRTTHRVRKRHLWLVGTRIK